MVPKRAFFMWVGDGPLPWIRQIGVDSFKKFNPDWKVDLVRVPSEADLLAAQSTDIMRYSYLAEYGGLYLDTDIVFFRPVPEGLLDADVAVTLDKSAFKYDPGNPHHVPETEPRPGFNNLAFMGSTPDNQFFRFVYEESLRRLEFLKEDDVDVKRLMYQVFGTDLLNRLFYGNTKEDMETRFGLKIANVPLSVVLPIGWHETHKLFNNTRFDPPEETIGVHWYGGCADAKRYCSTLSRETFCQRPCYLTSAINMALA